jgi:hypothetical protein
LSIDHSYQEIVLIGIFVRQSADGYKQRELDIFASPQQDIANVIHSLAENTRADRRYQLKMNDEIHAPKSDRLFS